MEMTLEELQLKYAEVLEKNESLTAELSQIKADSESKDTRIKNLETQRDALFMKIPVVAKENSQTDTPKKTFEETFEDLCKRK